MATYTSNYAWTKPGGNDQVDISVLNGNLDSQDTIMHKAFTNMAQAFSATSTYAVDDIVLYDNDLYKCHTAVTVAGAWTGSTNWTSWTLAEGGGGGTSNYNDLTNKPSINGVTLSGNKTTSDLGINADNVMMSDGVTSVEDALDEVATELSSAVHFYKITGQYTTNNTGAFSVNTGLNLTGKSVFAVSNIADTLQTPYHVTINNVTDAGVVTVRIRNLQDNTAVVNTQIYGSDIMLVIA